jgi:hypothetical protein
VPARLHGTTSSVLFSMADWWATLSYAVSHYSKLCGKSPHSFWWRCYGVVCPVWPCS